MPLRTDYLVACRAMPPITVRGIGVEARGGHLVTAFTLSAPPGQRWIEFFRERANSSLLGIAAATFRRNRVQIELPRQEDLEALIRSVEAIIEGVNLDVDFKRDLSM
jgi:hypothetical protein